MRRRSEANAFGLLLLFAVLRVLGTAAVGISADLPRWCAAGTETEIVANWSAFSAVAMIREDLDSNGYSDLVITSLNTRPGDRWQSTLSIVFRSSEQAIRRIILGTTSGSGDPTDYPFGFLGYICDPVVVDLDGDGFKDIAAFRQEPTDDSASFPSVAEVWWGDGTGEFRCTEIAFSSGTLAYAQIAVQERARERSEAVLVPVLTANQILQLESTADRQLSILPILADLLPLSPIAIAAYDLSGDDISEIVVAGFVVSSDTTVRRATVVLYSEDDYQLKQIPVVTFSEDETALSPISLFVADVDGDGFPDILATRRLDKTQEERLLPWSSHEELVVIRGGAERAWHVFPYPLWEIDGSALDIIGVIAKPNETVQLVLLVPDIGFDFLDVQNMYITTSCSIGRFGTVAGVLVQDAGGCSLVALAVDNPITTKLHVWMAR